MRCKWNRVEDGRVEDVEDGGVDNWKEDVGLKMVVWKGRKLSPHDQAACWQAPHQPRHDLLLYLSQDDDGEGDDDINI